MPSANILIPYKSKYLYDKMNNDKTKFSSRNWLYFRIMPLAGIHKFDKSTLWVNFRPWTKISAKQA